MGSKVKMCHIFNIFKMLLLLQITKHGNVTYAYATSRYLLQILLVYNFIGVNWGHMGQILFLRKIQLLVQITWYGLVTKHSLYIKPNLPRTLLKGPVSSGFRLTYFFLAVSFFLLSSSSHNLLLLPHALSDFDQTWSEWPVGDQLQNYQQFDLKGQIGVTGVKKVIFTENATPPTCFIGFWRNLVKSINGWVATKGVNSLTSKVM